MGIGTTPCRWLCSFQRTAGAPRHVPAAAAVRKPDGWGHRHRNPAVAVAMAAAAEPPRPPGRCQGNVTSPAVRDTHCAGRTTLAARRNRRLTATYNGQKSRTQNPNRSHQSRLTACFFCQKLTDDEEQGRELADGMLAFRFPLGSMASVDGGGACTGSEEKAEKLPMKMKRGFGIN